MSLSDPAVIHLELPELAPLGLEPKLGAEVYERRQAALRRRMADAGLDLLIVYADREHFVNGSYLTGFDPRFEEALVLLDADSVTIITGNESLSLVDEVPGEVTGVLCQAFSLPGQDRSVCPTIPGALAQAGVDRSARVGLVGWKPIPEGGIAVVQFVIAGLEQHFTESWQDVTDWFGAVDGVRTRVGADQLALHEHRATRASHHVWWAVEALAVGMSELDVSRAMRLTGLPHACNVMCTSGASSVNGLRSPTDRVLAHGDRFSTAVGLWGGLSSRAGWLVGHDEPGLDAYVAQFTGPYMQAQRLWYESLAIGANAGEIAASVYARLAGHGMRPLLNPGHFVHLDEWVNSPFVIGSQVALESGMALQCDIIPVSADPGQVANCEDSLAIADAELRAELADRFPEMWSRVTARRTSMAQQLGIELAPEVLPFSDRQATLPAGLLSPGYVVAPAPV